MDDDAVKAVTPPRWKVHMALITTQLIFGAGSVVGALGLPSFNPLVFAAIREGVAGPVLVAAAWASTGIGPLAGFRARPTRFTLLALTIFLNQVCSP